MFVTPCFPAGSGPDYVNAAVILDTVLTAGKVLESLHIIEADFGRERTLRWGERSLDLDLLSYNSTIVPDITTFETWRHLSLSDQKIHAPDELILPHPRIQDRAFVLVPLLDIAPDWLHPILGQTVREMVAALPRDEVRAVKPLENDA